MAESFALLVDVMEPFVLFAKHVTPKGKTKEGEQMSKTLLIILGNQLFNPMFLKRIKFDFIFMAEDYELCSYVKHHKLKILMFLLSMREYCVELRQSNYKVIYKSLEDNSFREKYENKLISVIKTQRIKKLVFFEIEDKFFEARVKLFARQNKLTVEILPSPMFLFSREDFKTFVNGKNKLLMGKYYQENANNSVFFWTRKKNQ